jgi:hypothetical protein
MEPAIIQFDDRCLALAALDRVSHHDIVHQRNVQKSNVAAETSERGAALCFLKILKYTCRQLPVRHINGANSAYCSTL